MLQLLTLLSLACALVQGVAVPPHQTRANSQPLQLDFRVSKEVGNSSAQEFWASSAAAAAATTTTKRDAYVERILNYKDLAYQMDIFLGSDKQKNTVILDTGSSDLWVPSTGYDPAASTSSRNTGQPFSVSYLGGVSAAGEYYLDTVNFASGNLAISCFQFGVADHVGPGILGIADKNQESSSCSYNNLPWALQAAGLTPKASYSLFLGDHGQSGTIIFGGIDTEKYTGDLVSYPIVEETGHLAVGLESVTFNGKNISVNQPALLDSGVSLGLLNRQLMAELDVLFNTTVVDMGGIEGRQISCEQPTDKSLDFNFGANTISLSYADAVVPQEDGTCVLAFAYLNDYSILGDAFLRKAYVYYDLSDKTISLAQASYSDLTNVISA
ncbi:hypothetical protein JCM33374_g1920 [Metschnikowia sp. JCM 33374]|nr:hypothetical protein JCM33374_g1920 [Metschnikowia sp. JCM 33374]